MYVYTHFQIIIIHFKEEISGKTKYSNAVGPTSGSQPNVEWILELTVQIRLHALRVKETAICGGA